MKRHIARVEMDPQAQPVDYEDLLDFCIEGDEAQDTPFVVEETGEENGTYDVYRVVDNE